ncbi:MAG: hypothetical protein CM15mP23_22720 [Cryomorphaceae bacterium]|nr:MAG: hypothetical protein CM15mP23_22720 [Cryomorphaceae bacterium]
MENRRDNIGHRYGEGCPTTGGGSALGNQWDRAFVHINRRLPLLLGPNWNGKGTDHAIWRTDGTSTGTQLVNLVFLASTTNVVIGDVLYMRGQYFTTNSDSITRVSGAQMVRPAARHCTRITTVIPPTLLLAISTTSTEAYTSVTTTGQRIPTARCTTRGKLSLVSRVAGRLLHRFPQASTSAPTTVRFGERLPCAVNATMCILSQQLMLMVHLLQPSI